MTMLIDSPSDQVFALVDCNNFYASCERVFNPSLQNHPIIVLSNNDGCAVAMSNEVKALGIKTGTPFFQIEHLVKKHNIKVFSSNYALYGDLSSRVMDTLSGFAPDMEIYSIDEAFLSFNGMSMNLTEYGKKIRDRVRQNTGIPVSVGIAKTKTLAKIANRISKKEKGYQNVLELVHRDDIDDFLIRTKVEDVWGIGRRHTEKLLKNKIYTALELKNLPHDWVKKNLGGIVGLRLVEELRGRSCIPLETVRKSKQGIVTSRALGKPVETLKELEEAISTYMTTAARKIRAQRCISSVIHVFIHTNYHKKSEPQYGNFASFKLPIPTSFTPEMVFYAIQLLKKIYKPGFKYKKAGIMLSGIVPENEVQLNLFSPKPSVKSHHLMEAVDAINTRWGRHTMQLASSGVRKKWKMRRNLLSNRYTTSWNELLVINI
jgi:DNA polymerase V